MEQNEKNTIWAKIVAKAWADEDYKQRLLADPASVMKAEGVDVPEGVSIKCVEDTESQAWLVLPPKPVNVGEVIEQDERLAAVVWSCRCCAVC